MPMSNADNPAALPVEEPAVEAAPAKKAKAASPEPEAVLVKASTSGSAEVHNLLAEREIAASNADETHLAAVDAKLAALGYTI